MTKGKIAKKIAKMKPQTKNKSLAKSHEVLHMSQILRSKGQLL
jgi:hypothetical protein